MVRCTLHDNENKILLPFSFMKKSFVSHYTIYKYTTNQILSLFFSWKMDTLKIQLKLNINVPTSSNFSWKFLDIDGI